MTLNVNSQISCMFYVGLVAVEGIQLKYTNKKVGMEALITRIQKLIPQKKLDIFGRDSLMNTTVPYYTLFALTVLGYVVADKYPFLMVVISYTLFPLLDEVFSLDVRNPNDKERRNLERNDWWFRLALYMSVGMSWLMFIKIMNIFSTLQIGLSNGLYVLGLTFIIYNFYAAQFSVAHQIMHKPSVYDRILATVHMVMAYYPHFTYHHLYCHHNQVATPEDPSTSLKGQTVYQFIPRCVKDSWVNMYHIERKAGKKFWNNYAVLSIVGSSAFAALVYLVWGLQACMIQTLMAFLCIAYVEAINYIEHYGLMRKKLPNGEYEKTTILHSWNAPHRFTNYLFFKLQRHSDHHENASKPYQTLVSMQKSPFLPHGYTLMVLMSFFPKVWFKVMDPLVDAYNRLDADKGQVIDPKVSEQAVTDTRKFLIEVGISSVTLLTLSVLQVI